MEHITPIKEIDSIKDDFTIKVRIIRLWTQKSKFDANDTYSIEMILMDEEGRKIHASCVKKWFPKFKRYLKEDSSIYVKKPNVAPNTSKFKFAHPESKLNFYHDTIYGHMDTSEQDKSKHKMLLHLQDIEDTKLMITLWGHNAYYMHDFLANNNSLAPIVVIVQFARVKFINGRPFSSTYFDVSRVFINNDIDEITIYKNKLVSENGQQLSSSGIKMIASKQDTEHDDFVKNHLFSNIEDLFEPLEEKTVIIVGTVKGIRQNIRWYYLACSNCKKSAKEKESSTDKVDGSHEVAEIVTYEYNTGTLTLTLFDQEAKKLFKYTGKELYDKNKKLGYNLELYPMELKVVLDRKLAIKIDITRYNVDNKSNIYGISRLTENADIIDELEKNNLTPQPANSDSFMIGSSDVGSHDTKVLKDSFLQTGENSTPCARDKSTATSPIKFISTPIELKRNLATCIDIDEMENLSTSKNPRLSPPDEQPTPLLVPKKEKSFPLNPLCFDDRSSVFAFLIHAVLSNSLLQLPASSTTEDSSNVIFVTNSLKGTNNNMYYLQARENRRHRKLYLDNKRSKKRNTKYTVQNPSTPHVLKNTDNYQSKNVVQQNENVCFYRSRGNQSTPLQSSPSCINVRTPLSNISNANISFNNYVTSTLQNKIHYSGLRNGMTSRNASTITASSSSNKLNPGCHKLKRKLEHLSPIPLIDLTADLEDIHEVNNENLIVGISKEYLDHGDQIVVCQTCHAKLWRNESIRGKQKGNTDYSLCCGYGKVQLPDLKNAPPTYERMFRATDSKSKNFMKNIRRYISMFSFTSMGGKIDYSINRGNAPYIFRLGGQNYHSIGSLLPPNGSQPKFSQLYIYDTENAISNRQTCFGGEKHQSTSIDNDIIQDLKVMLDSNNVLVSSYRMLRIIGKRDRDGRTYNLPTASEVAALIVGDNFDSVENRDIVVQTKSGFLQRISELHPSYLPLQYPLLFPYGDDGYNVDILHRGVKSTTNNKRAKCTTREFFAFRIQDRDHSFSLILNSKRFFQQFLVDAYTMIESERMYFIRSQQHVLRCESYENLSKQKAKGTTNISNIGQRVILPSSFTGGARYMLQNYLDAMSLCKWFGYPDFFITFTCNPKWPEVKRFLKDTSLQPEDRPDILCRLFKIKLDAFIKDLRENHIFGIVQAVVYTIEFQKRGLPHSHICLFMHSDYKLPTVELIDTIISAEIPNIDEDTELYKLVQEFMIHGPCGAENINCPCMVDNKCSKNFPKQLCNHNSVDQNGFPLYRRRNNGHFVEKSSVKLDNRNVVPYNKYLLKRYQAHINVEWCNQGSSIKYLFKYINKGPDRAIVAVVRSNNEADSNDAVDEINEYYDCRYLSACEASWRIFKYDVHYRYPSVVRLPFHLPGQQQIVYGEDDDIDDVLNKPSVASSMFTAWMECMQLMVMHGNLRMLNFLQSLFGIVVIGFGSQGPKSFEEIHIVNGEEYSSFRDACYALGLLDDDNEYIDAIKEASHYGSVCLNRRLFGKTHENIWQMEFFITNDIDSSLQLPLCPPDLSLNEDQLKNLTLFEIEQVLLRNNSSLKNYKNMPIPDLDFVSSSNNRLITEELEYDITALKTEFDRMFHALTNKQRHIFLDIMSAVKENKGGVFFVYGYGGTGKTFLWKTLSAAIRKDGHIVLNVASSGIASLLLPGGRTAHSRFIITFELTEDSVCRINPDSDLASLLRKTSLIIWDEAPMVHKHAFEALDRSLKDVFKSENSSNSDIPFGGKVIVFGGDFRQILPIIPGGSRQNIVNASLSSSYLWQHCKIHKLTKNMRLTVGRDQSDIQKIGDFANWLLDIGEGKLGGINDGETVIDIPDDILINDAHDPIGSLIEFVYPSILDKYNNTSYFQERAILAPKNEVVQEINDRLLLKFPGDEVEYLSSDSICQSEFVHDQFDANLYSPDVLNGLKVSGLPNHKLVLKIGVPVMLLRNIDKKKRLV
ncbi:uncharacterized protein LOC111911148 [Lactuca sativa]|uniref:uncharacterized protein LOC111911148 n=1 Tax=Lactuca sativa TaxID=4236 RepID=UPI0022B02709|nr:uncharacterized protein LOC111911148 [Lactuca sativa]